MGAKRLDVRKARCLKKQPVFIGGCPRSGTTLLLSILSASPNIFAVPYEMWSFWETETSEEFRQLIDRFFDELFDLEIPESCDRICEKTPKNVHVFDRLLEHFSPKPKLIHIVRDGRDVTTSVHPNDPSRYWVPVWQWVYDVSVGLRYEANDDVLTIRYEDLVFDFEGTMRKVCRFLDEPFCDRMQNWIEHASIRSDPAWFGGIRTISTNSVGRWRDPKHRAVVEKIMGNDDAVELLDRMGYLSDTFLREERP